MIIFDYIDVILELVSCAVIPYAYDKGFCNPKLGYDLRIEMPDMGSNIYISDLVSDAKHP